jgi:hypothetical protein
VHDLLMANQNIIDVEIAMTEEAAKAEVADADPASRESGPVARRIDFALLKERPGDTAPSQLIFFEAKLQGSKELRADGDGEPKVVGQIRTYEEQIERFRADIIRCYKQICENLLDLDLEKRLFGGSQRGLRATVEGIARGTRGLQVSTDVRLIVIGFDADQKKPWRNLVESPEEARKDGRRKGETSIPCGRAKRLQDTDKMSQPLKGCFAGPVSRMRSQMSKEMEKCSR